MRKQIPISERHFARENDKLSCDVKKLFKFSELYLSNGSESQSFSFFNRNELCGTQIKFKNFKTSLKLNIIYFCFRRVYYVDFILKEKNFLWKMRN